MRNSRRCGQVFIIVIFSALCVPTLDAEMRQKPSLKTLCEDAKVIVIAELIDTQKVFTDTVLRQEYEFSTFHVKLIIKGHPSLYYAYFIRGNYYNGDSWDTSNYNSDLSDPSSQVPLHSLIRVLFQIKTPHNGIKSNYLIKQNYILFLGNEVLDGLYTRCLEDRDLTETVATKSIVKRIEKIVAISEAKNFWDKISYRLGIMKIPEGEPPLIFIESCEEFEKLLKEN
jgi:hypothetical protein